MITKTKIYNQFNDEYWMVNWINAYGEFRTEYFLTELDADNWITELNQP